MSTIKGITDIFNSLTNLEKVKLTEQQLADKQNQKNIAQQAKVVAQERKDNLALTKDNLKNRREENETEINSLVQEIENWNIVAQDWSTIDDKFGKGTTEDGKEILNNLGIKYGENFKFKEKMSTDYREQLNNTTNLINFQDDVINDLSSKLNQITRLEEDWKKVGTDAANKGIKDVEDVLAYIESDTLGTDGSSRFLNEEGNPNYLGRAFMKIKETPTDTGFVDNAEIDAALSKITSDKETIKNLDEEEWNNSTSRLFKDIGASEDVIGFGDDRDTIVAKYGGKISSLEGREDLYSSDKGQKELLNTLSNKITNIIGNAGDIKSKSGARIVQASQGKSPENKIELTLKLYREIMPKGKNDATVNNLFTNEQVSNLDLRPGYNIFSGQDQEEMLVYKYLKGFEKIWSKQNPGKSIWDED
tara:strand:- start:181 stop:1437 length:1257 start_codon:yes stop_codon:yes gene_type:complete